MSLPNSLLLTSAGRVISSAPDDADPANRRKAIVGTTGKIWIQVPSSGAAVLYVKFGSATVAIDEAALSAETSAYKLEVGSSVVLDTGGAAYVDVYSASAWDVNIHNVG